MITDDELNHWKALCEDVTPGKWCMEFIAEARIALPALIAEVRRLQALGKDDTSSDDPDALPDRDADAVQDQLLHYLTLYIAAQTTRTRCLICGANDPEPCEADCPVGLAQALVTHLTAPSSR